MRRAQGEDHVDRGEDRARRVAVARSESGGEVPAAHRAGTRREQIPAGLPSDGGDDIEALCRVIAAIITRAAHNGEDAPRAAADLGTTDAKGKGTIDEHEMGVLHEDQRRGPNLRVQPRGAEGGR